MKKTTSPQLPEKSRSTTGHRSGAVARMLQMPVATLRVWERRYGVTQPSLSASGQRLYSADDVRRLAALKQLTDLGHAIGSLARLDMEQLQQVANTHAAISVTRHSEQPSDKLPAPTQPWRVAVIGTALYARLQKPALVQRLSRPVRLVGPFQDAAQAAAALQDEPADALVMHEPRVHEGWLAALQAGAPSLATTPKAVLYRFAAESTCAALATAGIALLREPQNDIVVGQWLQGVLNARLTASTAPREPVHADPATQPRRWDDAALSDFSAMSSTIACECPRHVAELLMQLAHFEAYSAECRNLSTGDAQLHAYLQQVASSSRIRFEQALEYVALHEGMLLPRPEQPGHTTP
ncbi:MerR family transcriptional regulator [Caenimonas sp. SL110]|uniref:MerR family transcriptional regulator n=1 Tax=Caenimonas sp. SL110 TaxID=1450524 RepID=UPI0009E40B4D|nr:MerR family transcriptional regulator [Caenimonas sp. SL110]